MYSMRNGNTHVWSFSTDSILLVATDQMKIEPSDEPTATYCPSGLKVARVQSQPTLKPSALQKKYITAIFIGSQKYREQGKSL